MSWQITHETKPIFLLFLLMFPEGGMSLQFGAFGHQWHLAVAGSIGAWLNQQFIQAGAEMDTREAERMLKLANQERKKH